MFKNNTDIKLFYTSQVKKEDANIELDDNSNVYELYQRRSGIFDYIRNLSLDNPALLFLNEIINFFQSLKTSNNQKTIYYSCKFHSLTLFFLRILEKMA